MTTPMAFRADGNVSTDTVKKGRQELMLAWLILHWFYYLYTVVFFVMTRTQPPPKPWWNEAQILQWFTTHQTGIQWGFALCFLTAGLTACQNGLIGYSMRRMSVSRAFGYSYIAIYGTAAFPGMLLAATMFAVGALRLDRDPELLMLIYDMGFLSFQGTMGIFLIGSLVWMLAILIDRNQVFPKWFGYFCLCNAFTEFVIVTIWFTREGPFAWNGVTAYWIALVVWGIYTAVFIKLLKMLVQRENFRPGVLPALKD